MVPSLIGSYVIGSLLEGKILILLELLLLIPKLDKLGRDGRWPTAEEGLAHLARKIRLGQNIEKRFRIDKITGRLRLGQIIEERFRIDEITG